MPVVNIEPTKDHPVPYDMSDAKATTLIEQMAVAGNTIELQVELGAPLEVDDDTADREKALFAEVVSKRKSDNLKNPVTAFAAAAFLRTYGQQVALDVAATRAAVTNKLMEIANCGDPRYELKALELLGKHSDIGLFTERSEITINYRNPEELENAIKERIKRLLNASVVDVTPLGADLDAKLGFAEDVPRKKSLADELLEVTSLEDEVTTDAEESDGHTE